jgi:D-aminopeptidase
MDEIAGQSPQSERRYRARELGIAIGRLSPGRWNAITDVQGVAVGHTTLISGEGPLVVGQGPVRTGVTVILPRGGRASADPVFAGSHVLNGNGEMTGLAWIDESGLLESPIAITNTHSVGVVRDALIGYRARHMDDPLAITWSLPVVAETYDGVLSDINGMHVKPEHVFAAMDTAQSGPVAEGSVGGGTGMICHGFKGGIGSASRVLAEADGGWVVAALVQANYGSRHLLRVDGVPVGRELPFEEIPGPLAAAPPPPGDTGSIIVIMATNAPLIPMQCRRLAQRATLGVARMGGLGANGSGDLFLAFATGNEGLGSLREPRGTFDVRMLTNDAMSPLFEAAAEAVEEGIANALCVATSMTGIAGRTAHALPLDRLREIMVRYGRLNGNARGA